MLIYNFVSGKKYSQKVTAELEKICAEYGYKLGLFATVQQMKNSDLMVTKGQKGHKVPMYINGRETYFVVFNIAQCHISAIERKLKTKTIYKSEPSIYPPKEATTEEIKALNNLLEHFDIKDGNGCKAHLYLDYGVNDTPKFNYQEYKARKIARLQELEKAQREFEARPEESFTNGVQYGYGMNLEIENCPF